MPGRVRTGRASQQLGSDALGDQPDEGQQIADRLRILKHSSNGYLVPPHIFDTFPPIERVKSRLQLREVR